MPKRPVIEDSDEDLEGFIVKDDLQKDLTRKKKKDEVIEESEDKASEATEEETPEEEASEPIPEEGPELAKYLAKEAEKLTSNLKSTEVGGRALRDRSKIEKPKDTQWEKYGQHDFQKLLAKDQKKDILDEIKAIKKDQEKHPENYEALPDDFKWPTVSARDSLQNVEAALRYVSDALHIEQVDDEESDEDEVEESEESSVESSESEEDVSSDSEESESDEDEDDEDEIEE